MGEFLSVRKFSFVSQAYVALAYSQGVMRPFALLRMYDYLSEDSNNGQIWPPLPTSDMAELSLSPISLSTCLKVDH